MKSRLIKCIATFYCIYRNGYLYDFSVVFFLFGWCVCEWRGCYDFKKKCYICLKLNFSHYWSLIYLLVFLLCIVIVTELWLTFLQVGCKENDDSDRKTKDDSLCLLKPYTKFKLNDNETLYYIIIIQNILIVVIFFVSIKLTACFWFTYLLWIQFLKNKKCDFKRFIFYFRHNIRQNISSLYWHYN